MSVFAVSAKKLTTEFSKNFFKTCKGFDNTLAKINFIKAGNGACLAELKVEEEHTNPMQTLHGAFIATIMDSITTYALMTSEDCPRSGHVSVNLNISYLKGAKLGDEVLINARTLRIGKTVAYLACDITDKATGDLLAQGNHSKRFVGV